MTIRAEIINAAFAGPRAVFRAAGAVFGTMVGVLGFPRTHQWQARVAW